MAERLTSLEVNLNEKNTATADGADALASAQKKHAATLKLLHTKQAATVKTMQVQIGARSSSLVLQIFNPDLTHGTVKFRGCLLLIPLVEVFSGQMVSHLIISCIGQ